MLRFHTAGESHGQGLIALVQGLPAGVEIDQDFLNRELRRRQGGYGRGGRMKIETDTAEILAGVRRGKANYRASFDKSVHGWVSWNAIENTRKNPSLQFLEAWFRTFRQADAAGALE